jgi:hypothetical protein
VQRVDDRLIVRDFVKVLITDYFERNYFAPSDSPDRTPPDSWILAPGSSP